MGKHLFTLAETISLINEGRKIIVTADDSLLSQLPEGNWIGGTIPYFMSENGGLLTKEVLFVDDFTNVGIDFKFSQYNEATVKNICADEFENGFTVFIAPIDSSTLIEYSLKSLHFEDIFKNPIVGYVAGFDMNKPIEAHVYFGPTKQLSALNGVALHIKLPNSKVARAEIINPNTIDNSSAIITFPKDSFTQSECYINGVKSNIAQYFASIDKKNNSLPLVANCGGALINRDIRSIDVEKGEVSFFSPLFAGDEYRIAKPVSDYLKLFSETLTVDKTQVVYSCMCVSYFFLGGLEGKKINVNGALSFGEIAYQLLNQTVVYLVID